MLAAEPRGLFSQTYEILEDGMPVAELRLAAFREAAGVRIDGQPYTLRRQGLGPFRFEGPGGALIGSARRPSAWRERFEVEVQGRGFKIEPVSAWGKAFLVREHGAAVGEVSRRSWWSRHVDADLPADLSLPERLFLLWLVLVLFRRADTAAASASSSPG